MSESHHPLRLSLLQEDITVGCVRENLSRLERRVLSLRGSDVIILPETFATGFDPTRTVSQDEGPMIKDWMTGMAKRKDAAVTGSVAWSEGGKVYNRMLFVTPDGECRHYDKRHLFSMAHEDDLFTPGSKRVVVSFRGVRILLQVCYDLRFPCFMRSRGDYDLMILSAAWPASRKGAWETLLKARALENQCYVAAVNCCAGVWAGESMLLDAKAHVLGRMGRKEGTVSGEVDMEALEAFRRRFPVLRDRDTAFDEIIEY